VGAIDALITSVCVASSQQQQGPEEPGAAAQVFLAAAGPLEEECTRLAAKVGRMSADAGCSRSQTCIFGLCLISQQQPGEELERRSLRKGTLLPQEYIVTPVVSLPVLEPVCNGGLCFYCHMTCCRVLLPLQPLPETPPVPADDLPAEARGLQRLSESQAQLVQLLGVKVGERRRAGSSS
jgi:hypothetical protein